MVFTVIVGYGQNVAALDSNFENYLETHDINGNTVLLGAATSLGNGTIDNLLTLSKLEGITVLNIPSLGINNLDIIQAFVNLETLDCSGNNIEYLDLSDNTKLVSLDCSNNDLQVSLDVSNKDALFSSFDASGNTDLECIGVDLEYVSYMELNFSDGKGVGTYNSNCTETWVGDANFENYLETHDASGNIVSVGSTNSMGNGIAADNKIFVERVNTVVNLDVSNQSIASVHGIEQFVALETFNCSSNSSIAEINLWNSGALETIDFSNNNLSYIGFHSSPNLVSINGANNALLNVSTNANSALTTLDVSDNSILNYQLDLTTNTLLQTLDVSGNTGLNLLNLSNQSVLVDLKVANTGFSSLTGQVHDSGTLVLGANVGFTALDFSDCSFVELDLSGMTSLTDLNVSSNSLTDLNIKNGNNSNLTAFNATSNVGLSCVEVDSKSYMDANWLTEIDGTTAYSEDCSTASLDSAYLDSLTISISNHQISVNSDSVKVIVYNFLGKQVVNQNLHGMFIVKIIDANNSIRVEKIYL
ncbi:hypothetical protein [Flavicella sp.]|uniref:hypothetical protein n=1 Tax=Flavicella sp. TaxID=2957742 RepID=UPI002626F5D9|nr:hypothetical protein [Flavicella sp.]MDG1805399.1 hypothetical protein [Flavicella sp.]